MSRVREALVAAVLVGITLAVFHGVGDNAFLQLWDDNRYVTDNPPVLGGLRAGGVRWAFTTTHMGSWQPLAWLSLMLDTTLFGASPRAMHWVNAGLHAASVGLLFAALLALFRLSRSEPEMGEAQRVLLCATAALLWGLHPLRVESVAWLAERKDVLCGFFFFLLLRVYAGHVRAPSAATQVGVVLCLAAALLSKAMALTAPLLLVVLDAWPLGRIEWPGRGSGPRAWWGALWPRIREKAALFGLVLAFAPVALLGQHAAGSLVGVEAAPLIERIATASMAAAEYLKQSVMPSGLAAFYPYPGNVLEVGEWRRQAAVAAGLLTGLAALAWILRRRHPELLFGIAWYAICLAPVSGLVRIGGHGWADRYTYLPLVGPSVACVWLVARSLARLPASARRHASYAAGAGALAALAVLGVLTDRQVATWADERTLWTHARSVVPRNFKASLQLGMLEKRSENPAAAERYFYEAYEIAPEVALVRFSLGVWYLERGQLPQARPHLEAAQAGLPNAPQVHTTLGVLELRSGRKAEARAQAERALELAPGDPAARQLLRQSGR